jgi:hypothetical protein
VFIERLGLDKCMENMGKYGDLERAGERGTWEPCHKSMMGNGICRTGDGRP